MNSLQRFAHHTSVEVLDNKAERFLDSLSTSPDLSMRLQIIRLEDTKAGSINVAFLYDPIFVEARNKSYILDWGRRQTNQNVERYISRHKGVDLVFHVFTFPLKEVCPTCLDLITHY